MNSYEFATLVAGAIVIVGLVIVLARKPLSSVSEAASSTTTLPPPLAAFVAAVNMCASEDEAEYRSAVAELKRDPVNTLAAISEAYRSNAASVHGDLRSSLVLAAAATHDQSALPFLADVAKQPMGPVDSTPHYGSIQEEESKLRLMAIDGIEAIARLGDLSAVEHLYALVDSSDRAVQAAAVVALKYGEFDKDRFERLRMELPQDRKFLVDLKRMSVHDVPQIEDPTRHLIAPPSTTDVRPGPDKHGRAAARSLSPKKQTPKVG